MKSDLLSDLSPGSEIVVTHSDLTDRACLLLPVRLVKFACVVAVLLVSQVSLTVTASAFDAVEPASAANEEQPVAETGQVSDETRADEVLLEPGERPPLTFRMSPYDQHRVWDADEVDDFNLVDQTGKPFTKADLLGKPWIVNFIFAQCPHQCPLTSRTMMEFNKTVANVDLRMVTITVNPEDDTVDVMQRYSEIWGADPERWIFATGDPVEVWKLIREGFKVTAWENVGTARLPGMEFAHDNNIIHVNAEGKILGRYDSMVAREMSVLRRVLKGEIETPEEFQPAVIEARAEQARTVAEFMRGAEQSPFDKLPNWARRLPATNAMLNALATMLLILGFTAIKAGMPQLHKKMMLYAFGVSCAFLISYLLYHFALHHYAEIRGMPFEKTGTIRVVYFSILISHVILAALVPVLAITTIVKGLRQNWPSHRRWARVTFPIWLYVSVTGVIIYWMLYRL